MQRSSSILLALALSGCALNPKARQPIYETVYDCGVSETRGSLKLRADNDLVQWLEQVDGVEMQANLRFLNDEERMKFLRDGFEGQHFDHPVLFFDYPSDLKPDRNAMINGEPLDRFFGGARGGGNAIQKRVAINVFLSLNWKQIQSLRGESGMSVFLYDQSGHALKTLHFSQSHFSEIERALQSIYSQVRAKYADKEHLCAASSYEVLPDIIIVD